MVIFASTSQLLFSNVRASQLPILLSTKASLGLKRTITTNGVWRIRRRERSSVIEVFQNEESGYGDILPPEFVDWRNSMNAHEGNREEADMRLIGTPNQGVYRT